MSKIQKKESVLHDWTMDLTFQMQALLMTGMRGPDGSMKDNPAKAIVRFLRGVVLKPAGRCNLEENDNSFMWGCYDPEMTEMSFERFAKELIDDHDGYPHHFLMHLIHCAAVVGFYHPDDWTRTNWIWFYKNMCDAFHMHPESVTEVSKRLNDFNNIIPE